MSTLFDVTTQGKLTFPNRFIRASVHAEAVGGKVDRKILNVYEELAKGGVGTILTGYTLVSEVEASFPLLALYNDSFAEGHKQLVDLVHQHKARIISQIVYVGVHMSYPSKHTLLGPSAIENPNAKVTPKEATIEEIKAIQKDFADTALRAKNLGYDGVELHAAHSYFLCQFLNPYFNRRTDAYGGSIENRSRNTLETYAAVRAAVGPNFPIWVKINSLDDTPTGVSLDDVVHLSRLLAAAGVDGIEVSGAWRKYPETATSYFRTQAATVADAVAGQDVSVILTGGNRTLAEMTEILHSTKIRYFGLARPLLKNPGFVNELRKEAEGGK